KFDQVQEKWVRAGLQFLAILVSTDDHGKEGGEKDISRGYSFPVAASSSDVVAAYNLLYRQLFDRHRDMSVPISFLLDPGGNVVKNDPASAEALYGLGSAFLQQNKSKEAGDCFEKALHLHARYPGTLPNAWNNLGILAARERNTAAAIQHFQHALQIDPQHAIA